MFPTLSNTDQAAYDAGKYDNMSLQGLKQVEAHLRPTVSPLAPPIPSSAPVSSDSSNLSTGQMLGPIMGHVAQGALQGISNMGQDAATWLDRGANNLLGTHLSAPAGNVFALNPSAANTMPAKVGNVVGQGIGMGMVAPEIGADAIGSSLLRGAANMGTQGAMGAALSPNSPKLGGMIGAASVPISAAIKAPLQIASRFVPNDYASHILKVMTGGTDVDANKQAAANIIRNNYQNANNLSNYNYQKVFGLANRLSQQSGTPFMAPSFTTTLNQVSPDGEINQLLSRSQRTAMNNLISPSSAPQSLQDANQVRSILGERYAKLKNGNDSQLALKAQDLGELRQSLTNDMNNHMNSLDPSGELASNYQDAVNFHRTHVVPYTLSNQINAAATNQTGTIPGLSGQFSDPDVLDKTVTLPTGETIQTSRPAINTIAEHGGEGLKNRIVGDALKSAVTLDPNEGTQAEKMIRAFNALPSKGLGSYVTPGVQNMFNELGKQTNTAILHKIPVAGQVASWGPIQEPLTQALRGIRWGAQGALPLMDPARRIGMSAALQGVN